MFPALATPVVGAVDVVSAAAVGIYMGSVTYKRSLDEYSKDGYLSLGDKRDADIDALMAGLYGFTHKITYEVDDIFFEMINEANGNKYESITTSRLQVDIKHFLIGLTIKLLQLYGMV